MSKPRGEKRPNPWDVAPLLEQGDVDAEPLFSSVGKALTAWEKLDQVQANLFGIIVGSRRGAAVAAYGLVAASSARTEMMVAAAEIVLAESPELLGEVTAILTEIGRWGARRNDIAHGVVSHYTSSWNGEPDKDHGHYLIPASYATRKRAKVRGESMMTRGKYAYTAAQVMTYAGHFQDAYHRLVKLMFRVNNYCDEKWPEPPPLLE